jgi:hypothetical protein
VTLCRARFKIQDPVPLRYGMEVELIVYDGNGNPFCFGRQIWCSEMAEFTVLTEPS